MKVMDMANCGYAIKESIQKRLVQVVFYKLDGTDEKII